MTFRAVASLFALLLLAGCVIHRNSDVASVSIVGKACPNCYDNLSINRTGSLETEDGQAVERALDPASAAGMLDDLPLGAVARATWPAIAQPRIASPTTMVLLDIAYRDGSQMSIAVPAESGDARTESLSRWVIASAFQATQTIGVKRERAIANALSQHTMQSIQLETLGCYGWCPAYSATFGVKGEAHIRDQGPKCDATASAHVPFDRVSEAISLAPALRPYYAIRARDTLGARITMVTLRGTYVSYGPDDQSWPVAFATMESRLDQIVRDTTWTPRIDLDRCTGRKR